MLISRDKEVLFDPDIYSPYSNPDQDIGEITQRIHQLFLGVHLL